MLLALISGTSMNIVEARESAQGRRCGPEGRN